MIDESALDNRIVPSVATDDALPIPPDISVLEVLGRNDRPIDSPAFAGDASGVLIPEPLCESEPMTLNAPPLAFMGAPGLPELLVIAVIILLLFGGSKLPSLMRNLGRSTNEFKRGMSESSLDDEPASNSDEKN